MLGVVLGVLVAVLFLLLSFRIDTSGERPRNVEFANPEFAKAITDKQVAEQQIRTEEQNLCRAQIEKQTVVAQARGEAESRAKKEKHPLPKLRERGWG